MSQKRVLFICIHNSARSQIAEAIMRDVCGETVQVESAGLTPGTLNPLAIEVLKEIGIDISSKQTRSVFDVYKSGALFSHVITVCDEASAEKCPVFPGVHEKLHWSLPDPSAFEGTWAKRLEQTRKVREEVMIRVHAFCEEHCSVADRA
jgi:arsenate reductase (thioredoxin)